MRYLIFGTAVFVTGISAVAELRVPPATAYFEPDTGGARIQGDVVEWKEPSTSILWYGQIRNVGPLRLTVELGGSSAARREFSLTVARVQKSDQQAGRNRWSSRQQLDSVGNGLQQLSFPEIAITESGYYEFRLESHADKGDMDRLQVGSLILDGEAVADAHFNLKPRRNAASVHLSYPVDAGTKVSAFYCEMTGVEDPLWTYYMACGWHRGYFGMQVNSPTERRIIFSVWDSGGEAVDRKKVGDEDRVQLIAKGDGVYSGDFGNEGTGGHSHLKYWWKTGEKQRFLVTAEPVGETHTIYAGYYFHPDSKKWMLISSWKAPKEAATCVACTASVKTSSGATVTCCAKLFLAISGFARRLVSGRKSRQPSSVTMPPEKRIAWTASWASKRDSSFCRTAGLWTGLRNSASPFERVPSGQPPADMPLPPLPVAK